MFVTKDDIPVLEGETDKALERLNLILAKVARKAVEDTLRSLPAIMNNLVIQASALKALSEDFYTKNKEFVNHKDLVKLTIEEIEAANPGKNFEDILKLAAPEIERKITLKDSLANIGNKKPTLSSLDSKLGEL